MLPLHPPRHPTENSSRRWRPGRHHLKSWADRFRRPPTGCHRGRFGRVDSGSATSTLPLASDGEGVNIANRSNGLEGTVRRYGSDAESRIAEIDVTVSVDGKARTRIYACLIGWCYVGPPKIRVMIPSGVTLRTDALSETYRLPLESTAKPVGPRN